MSIIESLFKRSTVLEIEKTFFMFFIFKLDKSKLGNEGIKILSRVDCKYLEHIDLCK